MSKKYYFNFTGTILLIFLTVSSVSCSGEKSCYTGGKSYNSNYHYSGTHNDYGKRKKYSFSSHYKGEKIYWKVYLEDDEIVKVMKNGKRIPDSNISEYEDYLNEKICDLKEEKHSKNRIIVDSDDFDFDVDIDFDGEEFAESMEKLGEALSNLDIDIDVDFDWDDNDWEWDNDNDYHFEWNSDEFKENMKKLKHNLKKLERSNFNIDIDIDGFAEGMSEFAESMKDFKIDMSGLEESMDELKEELENLKDFVHEMNEELVDDGYIEDEDEDYDLELDRYAMYVNGERLPDELHRKYIDMYVDYFGHEPNSTFRIND